MPDSQHQISAQLEFIKDALVRYVQKNGGAAAITANVQDLWLQSSQNNQTPTIFVCYDGEDPWGDFNTRANTHRVKRNFIVRVKKGRGWTADRGQTFLQFSDVLEDVRDLLRSMLGITEDQAIDYSGMKPVRLGNTTIDCEDITFSTMNDLPTIQTTED